MKPEQHTTGRLRRWRGYFVRYVGGGVLGAVVALAVAFGLLLTVLHYASRLADVDINTKVASVALILVFLCPLVGAAVGVVVASRRSKRQTITSKPGSLAQPRTSSPPAHRAR